jgi:hypothetical protein
MSMAKPARSRIAVTGLTCGFGESHTRLWYWLITPGAFRYCVGGSDGTTIGSS